MVSMSPVFYEGHDSVKAKFSQHNREKVKLTMIGNDVWIGKRAIIKEGLTIGTGSVIGMGSVVTKDVEPYTIVADWPAKIIRKRFDAEIIDNLLKSEWWNFDEKKLKVFAKYFADPNLFFKMYRK